MVAIASVVRVLASAALVVACNLESLVVLVTAAGRRQPASRQPCTVAAFARSFAVQVLLVGIMSRSYELCNVYFKTGRRLSAMRRRPQTNLSGPLNFSVSRLKTLRPPPIPRVSGKF